MSPPPNCFGCGVQSSDGLVSYKLDPNGHMFCDSNGLYYSNTDTAFVITQESTTSAVPTDLATPGPSVSLQTGVFALVTWNARIFSNSADFSAFMMVAVSGASNVPAAGAVSIQSQSELALGYYFLFTTLTPGINTFTAKYSVDGGATGTFSHRRMTVFA